MLLPPSFRAAMEWAMNGKQRPPAVVTGGSHGIGFELAKQCLENGFDVVIAADRAVMRWVARPVAGSQRGWRMKIALC
jgi:NAD(P)-dependent dehydrogenase (short-subunit alcohol dehydrogenase family)